MQSRQPFNDNANRRLIGLRPSLWCLVGWVGFATFSLTAGAIEIAPLDRKEPVSFQREILPILRASCLACHNASDSEGELVLESPATISKGGSSGPVIVPGKSGESSLLRLAAHQEEPIMPPADNTRGAAPLTPEHLALLQRWIDEGAKGDSEEKTTDPLVWLPLPADFQPILATSVSTDGRFAACARGNQLFVYSLPAGRLIQQLVDPTLVQRLPELKAAADVDLINAVSFSPDGRWLASGGFRTARLWYRAPSTQTHSRELADAAQLLATSPDGQWTALALPNGQLELTKTGQASEPRRWQAHEAAIVSVQFSADSKLLFSAGDDQTILVWNAETGAAAGTVPVTKPFQSFVVLDNGAQVATAGTDHVVRIWARTDPAAAAPAATPTDGTTAAAAPPAPPQPVRELAGHSRQVTALAAIATQPHQLVSAGLDGTWVLWDTKEGKRLQQGIHGDAIRAVATSADGHVLVSLGDDQAARLHNVQSGQLLASISGDTQQRQVMDPLQNSLTVTQANRDLAKAGADEAQKRVVAERATKETATRSKAEADTAVTAQTALVTARTEEKDAAAKQAVESAALLKFVDEQVTSLQAKLKASSEQQAAIIAQLEPTKQQLANLNEAQRKVFADFEKTIREAWDAQAKDDQSRLTALTERQQSSQAAVAAANKRVEELTAGPLQAAITAKTDLEAKAKTAAESVNRSTEGIERAEKLAKLADEELAAISSELQKLEQRLAAVRRSEASQRVTFACAALSADGSQLALGDTTRHVRIYDVPSGRPGDVLEGHVAAIAGLQFINGQQLLSLGRDQRLNTYALQSGWVLQRTIGDADDPRPLVDRVLAIGFSPDGKLLGTGSGEPSRSGQIAVWNVADGQNVARINEAHSDTIFGLEFSPSGRYIATGAADRFLRVFQLEGNELKPVKSFEGHTNHVLDVSWRANERQLATCGADNAIKVWNFVTGEQERSVAEYKKEVTSIAYVGIGSTLLTSSGDQNIRLYNADDLKSIRDFTGAESFVFSSAVSGDGSLVVAGGLDSVLRIWNGADGKSILAIAAEKAKGP